MSHVPALLGVSLLAECGRDAPRVDAASLTAFLKEKMQRALLEPATSQPKYEDEVVARETKFLLSSLSQFLTTPLRSDAAEVSRILGDALHRAIREGVTSSPRAPLLRTGVLLAPDELSEPLRPCTDAGRDFLERAFSRRLGTKAQLMETTAIFESSISPVLMADTLREAIVASVAGGTAVGIAYGCLALTHDPPALMPAGDSAIESVLILSSLAADRQKTLALVRNDLETLKLEDGVHSASVWLLFSSYGTQEQTQVRIVWTDQQKLESGILAILASVAQQAGSSAQGSPGTVWLRKLSG